MRKRRILASLLAVAMVMTSMPLNGFAEEGSPEGSMGVFMEAESDGALTENASADAFAEDAADSSSWDTAKEDLSDSQNLAAEDALLASQDLAAEDALLASQDLIAEDAFLASQDLETADAFVSDDTADTYVQGTDDAFYDPQDQETDDASAQLDADTFDGNPSDLSGEDISDLADGMSLPVFDSVSDADTETNTDANTDINAYPDEEANADTAADLLDLTDSRAFDEEAEEEPDGAYAEAADGELSDEAAFEDALLATDFSSTEDDASELLFSDEDGDNPETAKVNITWEFGIDFLEEWDEAQQKNIKVSAYTETVEIGSEIRDCPLYYIPPEGKTVIDWSLQGINGEPVELYDSDTASFPLKAERDMTLYAVWADTFQVTFDANGGTFDDHGDGLETYTIPTISGEDLTLSAIALPVNTQERMAFAGWSLERNGDIVLDSMEHPSLSVTEDMTLYAVWEQGWQVTLDAGENGSIVEYHGTETENIQTKTIYVTESCGLQLPSPEGSDREDARYSFDCWQMEGNEDERWNGNDFFYPQSDVTLKARYYTYYKIYWDAGEGYFDGDPEMKRACTEVQDGDIIFERYPAPEIADETKSFLGWSNVEGSTQAMDFNDSDGEYVFHADHSMTFYAVWAEAVDVTFDANGEYLYDDHSEQTEKITYKYAKGLQIDPLSIYPSPSIDNELKYFAGWCTSPNEEEGQYWDGSRWSEMPKLTLEGDITFYAIWKDYCLIHLDLGEAVFDEPARYYNADTGVWEESSHITTEKYRQGERINDFYLSYHHNLDKEISGWSRNPDGTDPVDFTYYDEENGEWRSDGLIADHDQTLYAMWDDPITISCSVNGHGYFYDDSDDEFGNNDMYIYYTEELHSVKGSNVYLYCIPSIDGEEAELYHFVEWNTMPDGSGESYEARHYYKFSEDTTLYAIWETSPADHEHHMVKTNRKEAACTTDGNIEYYTCSVCGKYFSDSNGTKELKETELRIPAKGHTVVNDPAVAATCAQTGKTAGSHCSVCNAVITAQKSVPAAGHISDGGKVTKAATCAAAGTKTYTCTRCKAVIKTEAIPATGKHTLQKVNLLQATVNTTGVKEHYKCTVCDGLFEDAKGTKATTVAALILPKLSQEEADLADEGDVSDPTSVAAAVAKVTKLSDTADPAGSSFAKLRVQSTKQTKNSITLKWNKVKGASGYIIYGNMCGSKYKFERIQKIKKGKTKTFTVTKLANGKKLKKGKYYKFSVIAYKTVKGNDTILATAKTIHVATSGGKVTNPGKVTLMKGKKKVGSKLSMKAKKSVTLKGVVTAKNEKLKLKAHFKKVKVKYESSNKKIATVNAKGKITAKKKGICYIYAYAQNGVFAKVKVNVQ